MRAEATLLRRSLRAANALVFERISAKIAAVRPAGFIRRRIYGKIDA